MTLARALYLKIQQTIHAECIKQRHGRQKGHYYVKIVINTVSELCIMIKCRTFTHGSMYRSKGYTVDDAC